MDLFVKKRWIIYVLIGIVFGIFDFFYQELTQEIADSNTVRFAVAWGIWLVPAIPVALYEAKISHTKLKPALANVLVWSVSVISYYLYMAVKLIFIGQASRPEMLITNCNDPYYWSNLQSLLLYDVGGSIVEWIGVAVLGGFVVGFLVSLIYHKIIQVGNNKIISK